jgi:hypothetical protein
MAENYVTVAGFSEPVQAEIARGRLQDEGIPVFVTGGMAATTFSGMGALGGRVELRVPAEHLARAVRVLAECGGLDNLTDEVRAEADDEGPVWLCPLCGDAVRAVLPICPACHTPRGKAPYVGAEDEADDEPEEGIRAHPDAVARPGGERAEEGLKKPGELTPGPPRPGPEAAPEVETDVEVPPLATMVGDAMARRAFYASLFGVMLPVGLFTLYSVWNLIGLALYRGQLSARGTRHLYLTLFLNGLFFLFALFVCAGAVRF